ncbi:MAG: polymer-forming cytoskeletal protein [Novosphingobium sp.]|nr:polymer-forming cytoskeletal protein [Novosphingobium sp.]MCP5401938.1 polymer-forming cytoskeletal protein [Novosphingobium sp.]
MFSKKQAPENKPVTSSRNASGSTFSVLGSDTAIKGDINASADLHIDGRVEGDIACAGLVQGETSEIVGGVSADSARLAGQVHGSINARELVILKSARIHGDVHYEALTIEQGAQVDGRLSPRGAQMPRDLPAEDSESHLILATSSD